MALMRAVSNAQLDTPEQRLSEELELLSPAQHARLEGSLALRGMARFLTRVSLLFLMPLVGFVVTILVASVVGLGEVLAVALGGIALAALVIAAFAAGKRLEAAGAAADLARKQRAVATLRELEVSSMSTSSSVAVPVLSSTVDQ